MAHNTFWAGVAFRAVGLAKALDDSLVTPISNDEGRESSDAMRSVIVRVRCGSRTCSNNLSNSMLNSWDIGTPLDFELCCLPRQLKFHRSRVCSVVGLSREHPRPSPRKSSRVKWESGRHR